MHEEPLETIKTKALELHKYSQKWHFHILTPTCQLNDSGRYAFILECPDQKIAYVYYSNRAEKEVGQELSPLLHGAKIMNQETTDANYEPTVLIKKMAERAKALNEQGVEWHHHVLYPGCRFNEHSPKYSLIVEDPKANEKFESLSDEEPTNDLKQIESQFYKK
jgi:hypothetical protein